MAFLEHEIRAISFEFVRIVTGRNLFCSKTRLAAWRVFTTERINRSRSSFHGVRNGGRRRKFIRRVDDFSTKRPARKPGDPFQMSPRLAHRGLARCTIRGAQT